MCGSLGHTKGAIWVTHSNEMLALSTRCHLYDSHSQYRSPKENRDRRVNLMHVGRYEPTILMSSALISANEITALYLPMGCYAMAIECSDASASLDGWVAARPEVAHQG